MIVWLEFAGAGRNAFVPIIESDFIAAHGEELRYRHSMHRPVKRRSGSAHIERA